MPDSAEAENRSRPKAPYSPPQLAVYGDLRDITQAIFGGMGNLDGVQPPFRKTSLDN